MFVEWIHERTSGYKTSFNGHGVNQRLNQNSASPSPCWISSGWYLCLNHIGSDHLQSIPKITPTTSLGQILLLRCDSTSLQCIWLFHRLTLSSFCSLPSILSACQSALMSFSYMMVCLSLCPAPHSLWVNYLSLMACPLYQRQPQNLLSWPNKKMARQFSFP